MNKDPWEEKRSAILKEIEVEKQKKQRICIHKRIPLTLSTYVCILCEKVFYR
jgi:hypothetical protein